MRTGLAGSSKAVMKIQLQCKNDQRGDLIIIEEQKELPFSIKRAFYVRNPKGIRGQHALRTTFLIITPVIGSLTVTTENSHQKTTFELHKPDEGLLLPPMTWSEQKKFSANAIYLVLASEIYMPEDYIHEYEEFKKLLDD
ncbi:MAG: FdtA/QdtA family cupin domain-containing protein [Paracoccaceae bacterium]